jgi:hypothetical protein
MLIRTIRYKNIFFECPDYYFGSRQMKRIPVCMQQFDPSSEGKKIQKHGVFSNKFFLIVEALRISIPIKSH